MKIGILTTFSNLNPEYSLSSVVRAQLQMLVKHGYEPVLFALNIFNDDESVPVGVELRKIVPQLVLEPYALHVLPDVYEADVKKAQIAFEENMQDIEVCLTHDIIFQSSFLPYNTALRNAIDTKLSKVGWLHWMHSAPSIRPTMDGSPWDNLWTLPKNSKLVYMNYTDVVRAAEMYGVWEKDVRTIFNPLDIRDLYKFHPISLELIERYDLMSAEIIDVYPLSTTRMGEAGKQLGKVIEVMGRIKAQGKSIRLIVCNAHANAKEQKEDIEKMYQFAAEKGVERRELIFTSLHDIPNLEQGVPHDVVRDMFTLANIFIFPSVSENCPLVLLEAMAAGCILCLNGSFPAMKDLALENAMYFRFGSLVDDPRYPNGYDTYMSDVAKIILSEYNNNRAIKAKTRLRMKFNYDYIFRQQLEPAIKEFLYGESV